MRCKEWRTFLQTRLTHLSLTRAIQLSWSNYSTAH